ncbi:MAG: DUF5916 domain-containing protein [Flavobacterium sp.]
MRCIFLLAALFLSFFAKAQKKVIDTKFSAETISIDGKVNEKIWDSVLPATDFIMFQPDNGKPVVPEKRTEVKVIYDNNAIYISAIMYDSEPQKILREISKRDDFGTADLFGVFINGYNDGQQNFQFFVNAADGQADCIGTDINGEDYSWDAVWDSKALITEFGWVVEMRIPYAALRFSPETSQTWGVNFFREIRRDRQKYSWNFIDSKLGTFTQQNGVLNGIENIKTPTRLFLLPYSSFYLNANDQQKTKGTLKGGLDVKYGINDAFTLDAILIPDFGQTKYDDQILNLGPFEQQFNENRPFFTEGTDLFSKGNLVYSRRIGGSPTIYPEITKDEEITDNPASVNLINAMKISGRTKGGLGIGVLNAVTEKTNATIINKITGESRKELVEPLANYNVLVLDQRFRKNSSVTFVNTNVTRNGNFRDGNVSALVWDLNTKANTYNISGDFKYSYVNDETTKKGIATQLNFAETSGKYRYSFGTDLMTKDFDNNDLGINFQTNFYSFYGNANYRILNPTKRFNGFRVNYNNFFQCNKETGQVQGNNININTNIETKKNNSYGFGLVLTPFENYDYYEPRQSGRFVITPKSYGFWVYYSRNYNYKFAFDVNPEYFRSDEPGREFIGINVSPRYRFNDKLAMVYDFGFSRRNNNKGYIDKVTNSMDPLVDKTILFANRNVVTYSHTLAGKYSINSQVNFNLALRQYWSYAENKNILMLSQNGRLVDFNGYDQNKNSSFYSWNLDVSCSWWFAPGSQVSFLYRNNSANFENLINKKYRDNLDAILTNEKLQHTLSISVRYFIDYNEAKNLFIKS